MYAQMFLHLAQRALHDGHADVILFLSGDQHWAELLAKRMPASPVYGSSRILYEVTASGIMQNFDKDIPNANRMRDRSANWRGSGPFVYPCVFPFIYEGWKFLSCTHGQELDQQAN